MAQTQRLKHAHPTRTEWSRLLSEFEASDTTQRTFCTERGLTYSSFCRWRKRFHTETPDASQTGDARNWKEGDVAVFHSDLYYYRIGKNDACKVTGFEGAG